MFNPVMKSQTSARMESLTPTSNFTQNESESGQNNVYNFSNAWLHNTSLDFNFKERFVESHNPDYLNGIPTLPPLDSGSSTEIFGKFSDGVFDVENSTFHNFSSDNKSIPNLPIDMQFNEGHRLAIIIYSLLMIISAVGNVSVFSAIIRLRIKGRLSRINLFLLNLVCADLIVTFIMMPLEIVWNATVSWQAGDAMCRVMSFFRIFGLYLSGFVLVCISLDRYFAVLKPLAMPDANSRGRTMLAVAWLASVLCSLPQSYIFHVEQHPVFTWYEQCITFNSFPSPEWELAYNFFGFFFLYGLPLIMIVFCYSRILLEIYRINALKKNEDELRRSSMGALGRAKIRTLKMTVIIVATFFFCWTPYNVMSLWYWFDKKSALEVDQRIQKGLFLFACTNSCVNPLIYGLFHFRPRKRTNGSTLPRSLPNGYHRPPIPSENYKMRVRWRHADCCIMGCGSTGNSDTTPVATTIKQRENYAHMRNSQQYWNCNGHRHFQCPHCHKRWGSTRVGNGHVNGCKSIMHQGHRRCSNFQMTQMTDLEKNGFRASTCGVENLQNSKVHYIDDKNSKRNCVSSIL